jgi:hypothetical protein
VTVVYGGDMFAYDFGAALAAAKERAAEREPARPAGPSPPFTCLDCGARFERGEHAGLREHLIICAGYMSRVPVVDQEGRVVGVLGDPDDPAKLDRHVKLYSTEGAGPWLKPETPSTVSSVIRRRSSRRSKPRMVKRAEPAKFLSGV